MILFVSYLIAGADVHAPFQIFQNFVDVPCPRRSQEAGVTVRLEETEEKHVFKNSPHYLSKPHACFVTGCQVESQPSHSGWMSLKAVPHLMAIKWYMSIFPVKPWWRALNLTWNETQPDWNMYKSNNHWNMKKVSKNMNATLVSHKTIPFTKLYCHTSHIKLQAGPRLILHSCNHYIICINQTEKTETRKNWFIQG